MGWCSATQHVDDVWSAVKEFIPEESKPSVAARICRSFEDGDWDCQDESEECYWVALADADYLRRKRDWFLDFEDYLEHATQYRGTSTLEEIARLYGVWKAAKGQK